MIQIAIFTGGKSPAMSKKLRIESEKIFKKLITKEDIGQIKIQNIAREIAKNKIASQNERKIYLNSIMSDKEIKQLIKEGQLKKAEKRAITILRNWK
jgi:precorrin-2 dehydrogenase/sirohydrochlorin ferrochelatase